MTRNEAQPHQIQYEIQIRIDHRKHISSKGFIQRKFNNANIDESKKIEPPRNHVWRLMILAVAPKTCAKSDRNGGIWVHVTIERSNVRSMKVQRCAYRSVTHTDTRPIVPPIHAAESLYLARLNRLKVLPNGKLNEVYSHNSTCYRLEMCQKKPKHIKQPSTPFCGSTMLISKKCGSTKF